MADALVEAFSNTEEKKEVTLIERMFKVKDKTLVKSLVDTLAKPKPKTFIEQWPM